MNEGIPITRDDCDSESKVGSEFDEFSHEIVASKTSTIVINQDPLFMLHILFQFPAIISGKKA
jgi:hypothetical protein